MMGMVAGEGYKPKSRFVGWLSGVIKNFVKNGDTGQASGRQSLIVFKIVPAAQPF